MTVNVNYRYLDEELLYLLDNSDAEALFFHSSLGDRVARVVDRLPKLKLLVEVSDDGEHHVVTAIPYNTLLADYDPMPRITRDEDDIYMLYTGGTTGMPKGVMYRHGDLAKALAAQGYETLTPVQQAAMADAFTPADLGTPLPGQTAEASAGVGRQSCVQALLGTSGSSAVPPASGIT